MAQQRIGEHPGREQHVSLCDPPPGPQRNQCVEENTAGVLRVKGRVLVKKRSLEKLSEYARFRMYMCNLTLVCICIAHIRILDFIINSVGTHQRILKRENI